MFKRYRYTDGLTSLIGSNGKYLINYLGEVMNQIGHRVETSVDDDGHIVVSVIGFRGQGVYRVIELMVHQYKRPHIPVDDYDKIQPFVIDGDKSNVQAKNIGYRFKEGRLEVASRPSYFHIPMYTRYGIHADGTVLNIKTGTKMKYRVMSGNGHRNIRGGYFIVDLRCDNDKVSALGRHRALGLVFLDYPDCVDNWVVNHIDGMPGNDVITNLEWVSRGRNNTHAYESDLKNRHKRVLVRDVFSGEVSEYYSLAECARQLGYPTHETISFRLRAEFSKVFQDGKQFKFKDDERDWIIPTDPQSAVNDAIQAMPIKVRDCRTLIEVRYNSSSAASRATGTNNTTVLYRIKKDDRSPLRGYQFANANDERPWPEFSQEDYLETLEPAAKAVEARNLLTGDTEYFPSIKRAHDRFAGDVSMILRSGRQVLRSDGWQLKLEGDEFEVVSDIDNRLYSLRSIVVAKNVISEEVIVAESARQMANHLGLDPKAIRKAALTRGKVVYKGFRFKLGTDEPWPL